MTVTQGRGSTLGEAGRQGSIREDFLSQTRQARLQDANNENRAVTVTGV